jgi:lysophospholipase L1-like esterase
VHSLGPEKLLSGTWHKRTALARRISFSRKWLEILIPAVAAGILFALGAKIMAWVVIGVATTFFGIRRIRPGWGRQIEWGIGVFAEKVAHFISWILLGPFFFVGLTLAKIGQRLSQQDPLILRQTDLPSFWLPCDSEARRRSFVRAMFCTERIRGGGLSLASLAFFGLLLLASSEIGLRIYGFGDPLLYQQDPEVGFYFRPNQDVRYPGRTIQVNKYGMRSPDFPEPKPAGEYRILMLGDSTLAGTRVGNHELYSSLLETKLNENSAGKKFRVLNAGVNAWGPLHMLAYVQKYGSFESDLGMILGPVQDVFRPKYGLGRLSFSPSSGPPRLALEQIMFELLWRYREVSLGRPDWNYGPNTEKQTREGTEGYVQLGQALKESGAQVYFELLPGSIATLGKEDDPGSQQLFDQMVNRFREAGFEAHLTGPIFAQEKNKKDIYYDGFHFGRPGHRLYADHLYRQLREKVPAVRENLRGAKP